MRAADPTAGDRDLVALPKAHLHVHLMGSMRRSTLHELAVRAGVEIVDPPSRFADWASFYAAYGQAKRVLRDEQDLARLVGEVVADAAADGAVWIEISVSPTGYRAVGGDEATMRVLTDATTLAARSCGVGAGLVLAADRERDAAEPTAVARLAVAWADRGVVGFGLAGDEAHPCAPFATAAEIAREAGLLVVPHAGELAGPDSVREALTRLRPHRLMHGVCAAEAPALVAELADAGVCLDVCPTSNVALGVVDDLDAHPLPALLRAGVACSINADDTLLFATGLADEYRLARHDLRLDDTELAGVARASLRHSAAPRAVVERALGAIDGWVADPAASSETST